MGRLTDDLQAVLGLKPSDRVSLPVRDSRAPPARANISPLQESDSVPAYDKTELGEVNENNTSTDTCLSCKVTGVGTLLGATGFVCYFTFKNAKQYNGLRRVAAYGQGLSLATLLMAVAGCRAFNKGPFDTENADKSISEQLKKDFATFNSIVEKMDQWITSR